MNNRVFFFLIKNRPFIFSQSRHLFFFLTLAVLVGLILGRYAFLMLWREEKEYILHRIPEVERGTIFDRHGRILASSVPTYSVAIWTPDIQDTQAVVSFLQPILNKEKSFLEHALQSSSNFVYLERQLSLQKAQEISTALEKEPLEGILLIDDFLRVYPQKHLASHLLGYVGIDQVGLTGAEAAFNDILLPTAYQFSPRQYVAQGDDVYLTLDSLLQFHVEKILQTLFTQQDPEYLLFLLAEARTGEILVYLSLPNFDPNHYQDYRDRERHNAPISLIYEPGSTFKVFTVASFLDSGAITQDMLFYDDGIYQTQAPDGSVETIRTLFVPKRALSVTDILIVSSNVGMALASDFMDQELFYRYLRNYGFGSLTGISLPREERGLLQTPSSWSLRTKPTLAFGQEIGVTAIQMLSAATTLANHGIRIPLKLLKKVTDATGQRLPLQLHYPEPVRVLQETTASTMLEILKTVGDKASSRLAKPPGYTLGAKTGTGQAIDSETHLYSEEDHTSSILVYFPGEDPQYIAYLALRYPKEEYLSGRILPLPMKEILQTLINYDKMTSPPQPVWHDSTYNDLLQKLQDAPPQLMPSLIGLNLQQIHQHAITDNPIISTILIEGIEEGVVIEQSPSALETLSLGSEIRIRLGVLD